MLPGGRLLYTVGEMRGDWLGPRREWQVRKEGSFGGFEGKVKCIC